MAGWPEYITKSLQYLENQYPGDELSVEAFVSLWRGLDQDKLIRAAEQNLVKNDQLELA